MPEGPELYKASCLVNEACAGRIFTGKVIKSAVNKNQEIDFSAKQYTISAEARGKEVALNLIPIKEEKKSKSLKTQSYESPLRILFRFGMSGKFRFGPAVELHKHAHLNFYTDEKPQNVLSFIDVRRFGSWEISEGWSPDRGPDPMFEYEAFRSKVLNNLSDKCFNKSICETLLNQKYFNGIGNYLRAEILFRAKIPPFVSARSVLEKLEMDKELPEEKKEKKTSNSTCNYDLLELCHILPKEVIGIVGAGYDPEGNHGDYSAFTEWLQCYYNPEMRNLVDHDGRTIWFKGEAGPLAPKASKSRGMVASRKRKSKKEEENEKEEEENQTPVKKRKTPVKEKVKKTPKNGEVSTNRRRASKGSAKGTQQQKGTKKVQAKKKAGIQKASVQAPKQPKKTTKKTSKVETSEQTPRRKSARVSQNAKKGV